MSAPFLDRLRTLRALEDRLADALEKVCAGDCTIDQAGGDTIARIGIATVWGNQAEALINLSHLAEELSKA